VGQETTNRYFDELATGLASGSISRGKALKLMGAALLGGTLASLGIGEAGADPPGCKRNGKKCKRDTQCCSGNCDSSSGTCAAACGSLGATCTSDGDCCSGRCFDGLCLSPTGPNLIDCRCVNMSGISTCSSVACNSADEVGQVCAVLCAPSGGEDAFTCGPEAICGAS
jgi:hypothetical protein